MESCFFFCSEAFCNGHLWIGCKLIKRLHCIPSRIIIQRINNDQDYSYMKIRTSLIHNLYRVVTDREFIGHTCPPHEQFSLNRIPSALQIHVLYLDAHFSDAPHFRQTNAELQYSTPTSRHIRRASECLSPLCRLPRGPWQTLPKLIAMSTLQHNPPTPQNEEKSMLGPHPPRNSSSARAASKTDRASPRANLKKSTWRN